MSVCLCVSEGATGRRWFRSLLRVQSVFRPPVSDLGCANCNSRLGRPLSSPRALFRPLLPDVTTRSCRIVVPLPRVRQHTKLRSRTMSINSLFPDPLTLLRTVYSASTRDSKECMKKSTSKISDHHGMCEICGLPTLYHCLYYSQDSHPPTEVTTVCIH